MSQHKQPANNHHLSEAFVFKLGSALVDLSDNIAWRKYTECEELFVMDLQSAVTSIPPSSPNYSEQMIFRAGMVEGIKRMILRRKDILEEYRKKKEEDTKNDGRETTNTTYGHTIG